MKYVKAYLLGLIPFGFLAAIIAVINNDQYMKNIENVAVVVGKAGLVLLVLSLPLVFGLSAMQGLDDERESA